MHLAKLNSLITAGRDQISDLSEKRPNNTGTGRRWGGGIEKKSTPNDGVRAIVSTRTAITVSDPRYISELKRHDSRSDGKDAYMPPPSFTLSYLTEGKKSKIFLNQQPSVYQPDFSPKVVPVDVALHLIVCGPTGIIHENHYMSINWQKKLS